MNLRLVVQSFLAALTLMTVAVAQNAPVDGSFQVRYAANLTATQIVTYPQGGMGAVAIGDSIINFTNTGANNAGDICVNSYVFAPDEQLVACCSCKVTRNALYSAGVRRDLLFQTLTPAIENSVVIKLLATAAPAGNCNPASPGVPVQGMAAWGTTFHYSNLNQGTLYGSETPFANSSLSNAELNVMTSFCGFIQSNGSGYGICKVCQGNSTGASGLGNANTGVLGLGPNDNATFRKGLGAAQQ